MTVTVGNYEAGYSLKLLLLRSCSWHEVPAVPLGPEYDQSDGPTDP